MDNNLLLQQIEQMLDHKLKTALDPIIQEQSRMNTALEALAAGLMYLKDTAATKEELKGTKAELKAEITAAKNELKTDLTIEIQNLRADINKKLHNHERRIENLEKSTNTPNPDKN